MKKFISIFTICILFQFLNVNNAKAQKETGQIAVGAGVGWSLTGGVVKLFSDGEINVSPVWNGTVDYGLTDNFSMGAAFGYQTFKLFFDNNQYVNNANILVSEDVKWTFSRMNIALRPLFHFGRNEDLDMYTGLRVGIIKWGDSHDSSDPNFEDGYAITFQGTFGFQALFGMRVYFSDMIGMHFEAGLGAPFLIEGGISLRL